MLQKIAGLARTAQRMYWPGALKNSTGAMMIVTRRHQLFAAVDRISYGCVRGEAMAVHVRALSAPQSRVNLRGLC